MADYQETTAEGRAYRRCFRVIIDNPRAGERVVRFYEEDVATIGGRIITSESGVCQTSFDAAGSVAIRDIDTLQPTGESVSHEQVYQILLSAYMQQAIDRDEGLAIQQLPSPTVTGNE